MRINEVPNILCFASAIKHSFQTFQLLGPVSFTVVGHFGLGLSSVSGCGNALKRPRDKR